MYTNIQILGGTMVEAKDYCLKNNISTRCIIYSARELLGNRGSTLWVVGNYFRRSDWKYIKDICLAQEIVIEEKKL